MELAAASPDQIADHVPEYVRKTATKVCSCPICERVYWRGTHTEHMWRALERAVGISSSGRPE